jgi:hypothetical protein
MGNVIDTNVSISEFLAECNQEFTSGAYPAAVSEILVEGFYQLQGIKLSEAFFKLILHNEKF